MAEDILEDLADRIAIEAILIGYGRALDEVDLELLQSLFTEDCVVSYGPEPRLNHRGAAEVASALARMWRFEASSHHVSNVTIAFEAAAADSRSGNAGAWRQARASCYVLAWHRLADGGETIVYGQYRDILVKRGDGWRIAERRMLMQGASDAFRVGLHPAPRRPKPADLDLDTLTPAGDR